MMKNILKRVADVLLGLSTVFLCIFVPKRRRELIWGPVPIINNKYWSKAMCKAGWETKTLMREYYSINKRDDYDIYFEDLVPKWVYLPFVKRLLSPFFALLYIIRNAGVLHLPFSGSALGSTPLWRLEAFLFRWAGIKTILIPYGADAFLYSQITETSLRNGLLLSYPDGGKNESRIKKHVEYWTHHADVIAGSLIDGMGRWDCLVFSPICIDTDEWFAKNSYSNCDGYNGLVKVIHTPNHRGFKGTEFLIHAVQELKSEGLKIELVLLENVPNDKVRELMQEVDILAEQFIIGYAMSAIEGMASGLPVLSNLGNETYTRVFRRYGFLNECPILSSTPENLKENLITLVTNPKLREELGRAGRKYVEKYHSYETAQYLFGSIYEKLIHGKEMDLMNLFHPLKSEYNRRKPIIQHPLTENRLPISEGDKC